MTGSTNLKALSEKELGTYISGLGLPRFRADQLRHWIYERYATDIQEITEFSVGLRNELSKVAYISSLLVDQRLTSSDGTEKFLLRLEDGEKIESVLIPDEDRLTLCISSQVGCAMGCRFCLTGASGLKRNLYSHEIVDQILCVNRLLGAGRNITNIVLMGMGEPLANLDNVVDALWLMTGALGISKRKVTVSTSGLVPKIAELASRAPGVNLAISLNATTDRDRTMLMPVNKTYPLKTLLEACRRYPLKPTRRITFEYVMIGGINDSPADARRLAGLIKGIRSKVNLIPLNPHPGTDMMRPSDARVKTFRDILENSNVTVMLRESRGQDILAACGQLRAEGPHQWAKVKSSVESQDPQSL